MYVEGLLCRICVYMMCVTLVYDSFLTGGYRIYIDTVILIYNFKLRNHDETIQ